MIYFYVHKSAVNGQWYFNIRSVGNHKVIATSEGYHNKQDAWSTINVIRAGAAAAGIYDASTERWAA
jgi:uncharacterized protein YegP (UPF0339 family)